MANALQFIESDQEDLEPTEKKRRAIDDIDKLLQTYWKDYSNLSQIKEKAKDEETSADLAIVFRDVLARADTKAMDLINHKLERFIQYAEERHNVPGVKYEDIILEFEWLIHEVPKIESALS